MSEITMEFDNIKAMTEQLRREVDKLQQQVGNLETAIISLQNVVYGPKQKQPSPAQNEADVLAGLSPEVSQQLEVYDADGETRVKPKVFLGKSTWRAVNEYLKTKQFQWHSEGKNSYWFRGER